MGVKEAVQEQFGRAAAHYAVSPTHERGPDLPTLVASAPLPAEWLLDVGTGAGHTAFAFASQVSHVEALDLTQEMLDQVAQGARDRALSNVHCQLGDAESLPYPDASFDIVTSRLCAHHFQDVRAFAREVARVLRPGGTFLLVDSMAPEDDALDTFFNAFELLRDPSHVRNHSRSQWCRMLAEVGLAAEHRGDWMLHQDFDAWVERMATPPTAVAHLQYLFETADERTRQVFAIEASPGRVTSVGIPSSMIRATRPR